MKPIHSLLLGVTLLLGCGASSPTDTGTAVVEGTYTLTKIDGTSVDGLPVRVVSGTLTLRGGVYESVFTYSIWGPDDRGTISDRGRYEDGAPQVTLTSDRHFIAGPNGESVPRRQTATVSGRDLTYSTGWWTYHWRRNE